MMNTNMRRILKTPTLRMMDGGSLGRLGIQREGDSFSQAPGSVGVSPFTPPGVSPMPTVAPTATPAPVGVSPNAGKYGSAPAGASGGQGAAMDRKMLAASAAAPAPERAPMQFKDGGEVSPYSLKGMYNAMTGPKETISQKYERQDAERAARQPAPQPQNAPAPVQNIGGYVGNSALQRREKAAGLRNGGELRTGHGGHVPGTGTGDKIAAKYEPGEFVVSNAMLDAEPDLREHLRDLRTEVLAQKGMTPEQADAKAMSGGTLRAAGGFTKDQFAGDWLNRAQAGASEFTRATEAAAARARSGVDDLGGKGGYADHFKPEAEAAAKKSGRVMSAVKTAGPGIAAGLAGGAAAHLARGIGNPADSPGGTNDIGFASQIPIGGESKAPVAQPHNFFLDTDTGRNIATNMSALSAIPGVGAFAGAKAMSTGTAKVAGLAERVALPAIQGAAADTRAGRTERDGAAAASAVAQQPAVTTPRRIGMGDGVEAAPESTKLVQGADGRQYLPGAVNADDRLRSDALIKQAFSRGSKTGGEFSMNDGINTLRSSPNDMATANKAWAARGAGVQASYDSKGGLVLSNSTGPEKTQYTDREGNPTSRYENTAQFDNGQKQLAAATASLRNPDGSKWSENDNAIMAANLRDGVSQYAGTPRAPAPSQMSPLRARLEAMGSGKMNKNQVAALQTLRANDQNFEASMAQTAARGKEAEMVNQTNLRGQDIKLQGEREQAAGTKGNALAAKAEADRKYELDVARLGVEVANKNRDDKRAGEEAFAKRIGGMVGDDKDGVAAAGVVNAANMFLGDSIRAAEAELKTNPSNAKAARDLARLKKDGVNALDDKMISELVLGRQAASTAQEYDGIMPWSGKAKNSAAPIKTLTLKKGMVFDDYVSDDASGNQVIPARALRDRPDLNRLVVQ